MNDQWGALFRSLTADTLDTVDTLDSVAGNLSPSAVKSVNTVHCVNLSKRKNEGVATPLSPIVAVFSGVERRCPDYVDGADWQRAVEDGRRFLPRWGGQAEAFGWTPDDLFGLHDPPERPNPNYRRLTRLDESGLFWLLRGRPVVALTTDTAAIRTPGGGAVTFYKRP